MAAPKQTVESGKSFFVMTPNDSYNMGKIQRLRTLLDSAEGFLYVQGENRFCLPAPQKRIAVESTGQKEDIEGGDAVLKSWQKIGIIMVCLALLCGCQSGGTENEVEDPSEDLVYLSGYPDDEVPLLKPVFIDSCSFSVRDDLNYVIGKDLYSISFESEADMDELSEYYLELMDELDEDMYYDEYSFSGWIQGRKVNVSISDQARDNALGTPVNLSVGMLVDEYVDENPYFENYSEDLIEVFGFYKLQEYTYRESYLYNESRYATIYETREEADDILAFYRDNYSSKSAFKETTSGNTIVFSWEEDGYELSVRYDPYPNIQFLQLLADKDLP